MARKKTPNNHNWLAPHYVIAILRDRFDNYVTRQKVWL